MKTSTCDSLVAIEAIAPLINVGSPPPYPKYWVLDRVTGFKLGCIVNFPAGAFIGYDNTNDRVGLSNTLYTALNLFKR